jgi:hypothetical protein
LETLTTLVAGSPVRLAIEAARTLPTFVTAALTLALVAAVLIVAGALVLVGGSDPLRTAVAGAPFLFATVPLSLVGLVVLKRLELV